MALPTFNYTSMYKEIDINGAKMTFRPLIIKDFERIFNMEALDNDLKTVQEMALLLADLFVDDTVTIEEKQDFFKSLPIATLNELYTRIGGQEKIEEKVTDAS